MICCNFILSHSRLVCMEYQREKRTERSRAVLFTMPNRRNTSSTRTQPHALIDGRIKNPLREIRQRNKALPGCFRYSTGSHVRSVVACAEHSPRPLFPRFRVFAHFILNAKISMGIERNFICAEAQKYRLQHSQINRKYGHWMSLVETRA